MADHPVPRRRVARRRPATQQAAAPAPVAPARLRSGTPVLPRLTVEAVLYLGVVLLAVALRLFNLTASPLGAEESSRALSAWQVLHGEVPVDWQEPALVMAASASFLLFGASDLVVRLLPALAGVGLVAGCWLLREHLGSGEALLAAFLLAVSPLAVYSSRLFAASVFAGALSLVLIYCLLAYLNRRQMHHLLLGAVVLGVLLSLGAAGVQVVATIVSFVAVLSALGREPLLEEAWRELGGGEKSLPLALAVLAGTVFLLSTGLLANPRGLGLPGVSAWLAQFGLEAGGLPWHYHLQLLGAYEPLIALLGLTGAVVVARRWYGRTSAQPGAHLLAVLLLFWAAAAFVLLLATGRKSSSETLSLLVPLALLGGVATAALCRRLRVASLWRVAPIGLGLAVMAVAAYVALGFFTRPEVNLPWVREPLLVVGAGLLTILALQARQRMSRLDLPALGLLGLAALLVVALHVTARLSYPVAPEFLAPAPSAPDVAAMAQRVDEVYWRQRGLREVKTQVDSSLTYPFAWYLRAQPNVVFVPQVEPGAAIVIARGGEADSRFARYVVEKGHLRAPAVGDQLSLGVLWRWWVYGEGPRAGEQELLMYIGG